MDDAMKKSMAMVAAFAALNAAAVEVHVDALPDSAFIDTECATNICFASVPTGMPCDFLATIALEGTATNCYQLTFGTDTDGNGSLSPAESDFSLGWRAGRWFVERTDTAERFFATAMPSSGLRTIELALHARSDAGLGRVQILADGAALFPELAAAHPSWLFSRDWNIVKVVRRGNGPSSELCDVSRDDRGFCIMLD